ncbi:hypothetical protein BC829DRAFT_381465 [Chytridium lagenaria]|nr:hypothetical protein BC829DRAFT_381465 [Chytridium lagenaria]
MRLRPRQQPSQQKQQPQQQDALSSSSNSAVTTIYSIDAVQVSSPLSSPSITSSISTSSSPLNIPIILSTQSLLDPTTISALLIDLGSACLGRGSNSGNGNSRNSNASGFPSIPSSLRIAAVVDVSPPSLAQCDLESKITAIASAGYSLSAILLVPSRSNQQNMQLPFSRPPAFIPVPVLFLSSPASSSETVDALAQGIRSALDSYPLTSLNRTWEALARGDGFTTSQITMTCKQQLQQQKQSPPSLDTDIRPLVLPTFTPLVSSSQNGTPWAVIAIALAAVLVSVFSIAVGWWVYAKRGAIRKERLIIEAAAAAASHHHPSIPPSSSTSNTTARSSISSYHDTLASTAASTRLRGVSNESSAALSLSSRYSEESRRSLTLSSPSLISTSLPPAAAPPLPAPQPAAGFASARTHGKMPGVARPPMQGPQTRGGQGNAIIRLG